MGETIQNMTCKVEEKAKLDWKIAVNREAAVEGMINDG